MVTPFHLSVFCYRRWVLSTERLLNGERICPLFQRLFLQESRLTRTVWSSLSSSLACDASFDSSVAPSFANMLLLAPHPL